MEAYTDFAQVYDLFMDNVPYEEWCSYIQDILKEYGIKDGILLDLGCGTGRMTRIMAMAGYDMIGIDASMEMLEMARQQECVETDKNILYLLQDMREFELYGTVRAVYSACDCFNYILEEDDLLTVFQLVNNYLDPGGLFIFDVNTPFKYEQLLAENTFAENREEGSFIWENYYDRESKINEYDLTIFIKDIQGEKFNRFYEVHYQRCYELSCIRQLLEKANLEFVSCYDGYTKEAVRADSEKITIVARERGKA